MTDIPALPAQRFGLNAFQIAILKVWADMARRQGPALQCIKLFARTQAIFDASGDASPAAGTGPKIKPLDQGLARPSGGRYWNRTSDLLHVKQAL
jgi:hypothetical protein